MRTPRLFSIQTSNVNPDALGAKYVRTTRFAIISSGTSGTVTIPSFSQVVLDDFGGTVDAVVTQVTSGKPTLNAAATASGAVVATTFDSLGNWSFSGTPSAYPVAIVYRVQQQLSNFDSTATDIWGEPDYQRITSALSLGGTANIYKDQNASTIEFRGVSGSSFITVTQNASDITIGLTGVITPGVSLPLGSSGQVLQSQGSSLTAWSTATFPGTAVVNDMLFASATNTWAKLAGITTAVLVTGASSIPNWLQGLTANRLLKTSGTALSFAQADLTTDVTGILPVPNGGTGATTLTNHGVLIGQATSAVAVTAAGSAGQVLQSGGASADPTYSTPTYPSVSGTSGKILRSNGTNNLYSTATFPDTATTSDLLYASGTNAWTSLAKTNTAALITDSSGVPAWTSGGVANRILRTTGSAITFAQVALASDVTGTLGVTNGGTGTGTQFTAGSVVFAGTSGVYSQSNATFFWDDSNKRLGLGLTSPALRLNLLGTAGFPATSGTTQVGSLRIQATTGSVMDFGNSDDGPSNFGNWIQSTNYAALGTTYPLLLNPRGGNVGIGSTAPSRLLTINPSSTSTNNQMLYFKQTSSDYGYSFNLDDAASGKLFIKAVNNSVESTIMTLDRTTSFVGIGTTSPINIVNVVADTVGTGSQTQSGFRVNDALNTVAVMVGVDSAQTMGYIQTVQPNVDFSTRPLVLQPIAGKVGIGVVAPSAQLHTGGAVRFANFGAGAATFDASGNISSVSDERFKDVVGDFKASVTELKKIVPILYKWNAKSGLELDSTYAGFSAQNVLATIPEAIGAKVLPDIDSTDKKTAQPKTYYSLQDRALLAAVINAIKELDKRLQTLETT